MRVGNYFAQIVGGRELSNQYVEVQHGAAYTISLGSSSHLRTDAKVTVDGQEVGVFRLEANGRLTVEGPPADAGKGKFTFYETGTEEAHHAGEAAVARGDKGLVVVEFLPEKSRPVVYRPVRDCGPWTKGGIRPVGFDRAYGGQLQATCSNSAAPNVTECFSMAEAGPPPGAAAGVTGLSGQHDQVWHDAPTIEYDMTKKVTVSLRLVAVKHDPLGPRPLASGLNPNANPVPAPVA